MAFYNDKDLRKVPSVKNRSISNGQKAKASDSRIIGDVVLQSKLERELRAKTREDAVLAIRIQSWWRGRVSASKVLTGLRSDCDRKLSDISKLSDLLRIKNNVSFVPPISICFELARKLTAFGFRGIEDAQRMLKFCTYALLPTLSQVEPAKNFATIVCNANDTILNRLCNSIISLCSVKMMRTMNVTDQKVTTVLLPCLMLLIGGGEPFRMVYASELGAAFSHIRKSLSKNNLFRRIRGLLTVRSDSFMSNIDSDNTSAVIKRPSKGSSGDLLLSICMFAVSPTKYETLTENTREHVEIFSCEIMTVPMLTLLLSDEAMTTLASWSVMGSIIHCISYFPHLPLSPHAVFESEQWLLGNLASLCPYFNIATINPSSPVTAARIDTLEVTYASEEVGNTHSALGQDGEIISDDVLETYLLLLVSLYSNFDVPGVIQGKKGIMWSKTGLAMTAASVPSGLKYQLLAPLTPSVCSDLFSRILSPVRGTNAPVSASDTNAVTAALNTSGLAISQSIISEEEEAQVWFSSKWAMKIMGKMTVKSGVKLSVPLSSAVREDYAPCDTVSVSVSVCPFSENPRLTGALSRLWSVLLPHAVFSTRGDDSKAKAVLGECVAENKSWKALSLLSFGTDAAQRLWVAVEHTQSAATPSLSPPAAAANSAASTASVSAAKMMKTPGESKVAKTGTTTQSSSLGSFMNMFGFSSSSSSSSSSNATSTEKKESVMKSTPSRDVVSVKSVRAGVDVEDFAARTFSASIHHIPEGPDYRLSILITFAVILKTILTATDDHEFYTLQKPLPLVQYVRVIRTFKTILHRILKHDPAPALDHSSNTIEKTEKLYSIGCVRAISGVLSDLYLRWARRPFSSASVWVLDDHDSTELRSEIRSSSPYAVALLREMPWSINFHERMKIFREVVDGERTSIQGSPADAMNSGRPGVVVRVRRTNVLLDGMAAFQKAGGAIKDKMVVKYINAFGDQESGIDIGGLFKDFLTDLSTRVFDPSYGLFCVTSDNLLYPNPSAALLYPESGELEALYCFLGRVLGKALFENITIQPQFAHFFLAFMHGRYNFMNLVNDLKTFDEGLYKNLMFLKTYTGDIEDLCLTFSVTETDMGIQRDLDLVHGGSKIPVTSKNRHRYISAIAKYHLYDRLKRQAKSFFGGIHQVIKPDLFSIFCAPELQILISGTSHVSLKDLKAHARYAGYGAFDRNVSRLWSVLEELSEADSRLFLKFVTSCERPPSLGFSSLQPPFTVQFVEGSDDQRLPTASTCFNTLKLPSYSSREVLKNRLLTSIRSGAGFDLS